VIPIVGLFGGWTPTHRDDPCGGGHVGYYMEDGVARCNRCGRLVDLRPCGCGKTGHEGLGRSYCPNRIAWDQREVAALVRHGVEFAKEEE
jgi:hypothetical protein